MNIHDVSQLLPSSRVSFSLKLLRRRKWAPPFLVNLKTELGYTGMEISGAAGQCQPGVHVSGTLVGKMTQRLHAEAQVGPGSLAEWNHHGRHQTSASERRQGS